MQSFEEYTAGADSSAQENKGSSSINVLNMSSFIKDNSTIVSKPKRKVNNNKQVLLNSTLNDSSLSTNSFKQYGLNNWRQYAAEKHGNSKYFQESAEGRKCIENAAIQKYAKEMLALKHWADEVEKMAQQLLTQANADSEIQLLNNRKVGLSLFMWILIMVYI